MVWFGYLGGVVMRRVFSKGVGLRVFGFFNIFVVLVEIYARLYEDLFVGECG